MHAVARNPHNELMQGIIKATTTTTQRLSVERKSKKNCSIKYPLCEKVRAHRKKDRERETDIYPIGNEENVERIRIKNNKNTRRRKGKTLAHCANRMEVVDNVYKIKIQFN